MFPNWSTNKDSEFKIYLIDFFTYIFNNDIAQIRIVSGGDSNRETPVTISNTEVKPISADDTAWVTGLESRTLPVF